MILVLNILNHNQASWKIVSAGHIKYTHDFVMARGQDNILSHLDKFFKNNKLRLKEIKGIALVVAEASLTQVKIFTVIINTMGWQLNVPVMAEYYNKVNLETILKKLSRVKKFKALKIEYKRKPDISLSKKKIKYKLVK